MRCLQDPPQSKAFKFKFIQNLFEITLKGKCQEKAMRYGYGLKRFCKILSILFNHEELKTKRIFLGLIYLYYEDNDTCSCIFNYRNAFWLMYFEVSTTFSHYIKPYQVHTIANFFLSMFLPSKVMNSKLHKEFQYLSLT